MRSGMIYLSSRHRLAPSSRLAASSGRLEVNTVGPSLAASLPHAPHRRSTPATTDCATLRLLQMPLLNWLRNNPAAADGTDLTDSSIGAIDVEPTSRTRPAIAPGCEGV